MIYITNYILFFINLPQQLLNFLQHQLNLLLFPTLLHLMVSLLLLSLPLKLSILQLHSGVLPLSSDNLWVVILWSTKFLRRVLLSNIFMCREIFNQCSSLLFTFMDLVVGTLSIKISKAQLFSKCLGNIPVDVHKFPVKNVLQRFLLVRCHF